MEEGLGAGDLVLPDSIASGNYQLVAYTDVLDRNGHSFALFSTPITVKSTTVQNFYSHVSIIDSSLEKGSIKVKVEVDVKGNKLKIPPFVDLLINQDTIRSFELKTKESVIEIPANYLSGNNPVLHTIIHYNDQVQHLNTSLPCQTENRVHLKFFPEGGELAAGITSAVPLEAKTDKGAPLALSGILYRDNTPIDTIETNRYGLGRFKLTPDRMSRYTLKVKPSRNLLVDTAYALPNTTEKSVVLHIAEAVTNDTLRVELLNRKAQELQVLIHNNKGFYTLFKVKIDSKKSTLKIPLNTFPKGIATLTVLDELGRPLAESLFFAHYDNRIITDVRMSRSSYATRDTIDFRVKVTDLSGKPLTGLFSVRVVQANRLENSFQYIDDYIYLKEGLDLALQRFLGTGKGLDNKDFLEDMLLVKGWRRYTWQHLMGDHAPDSLQEFEYPKLVGQVKKFNKILKESVELVILGSQDFSLIKTEQNGSFQIATEQLYAQGDNKIRLMVSSRKTNGFSIAVDDPVVRINKKLAEEISIYNPQEGYSMTRSEDELSSGLANTRQLQEVMIKGRRENNTLYGYRGKPGANACGDYVDEYDYLNYEYSVNRYQPVEGKVYRKRTDLNGTRTLFMVEYVYALGCRTESYPGALQMEGIYGAREFYGVDLEQPEPQYLSTLFWKSLVVTDEQGEAAFNFSAGDIKGGYQVIVQGITDNDVFSGTSTFRVE